MNFLHISDLHIGKKLLGKPLFDDQRHVLSQIVAMAAREDIDAVLIAGDLYDKSQPSSEAIELAGDFLTRLAGLGKPAFVISGNHDSAEQVAYCRSILSRAQIHVSPVFEGPMARHVLHDAHGEVHVYMLPFIRPAQVRRAFPSRAAGVKSYADAVRVAVEETPLDPAARNVLVAHQYVVGGEDLQLTDSEDRMIGGIDAVPVEIFDAFDYVALGHLHAPQKVGRSGVRYAGSMLKYSLSEEKQRKAALRVQLGAKEEGHAPVEVEQLPYAPLHDVKSLRGTLEELTSAADMDSDYVFVTLTDERPLLDAVGSLLLSYPNMVHKRVENSRSMNDDQQAGMAADVEKLSPIEHFMAFFAAQNNGQAPDEEQYALMERLFREAEEELHAPDRT